jgi:hypothetical protein
MEADQMGAMVVALMGYQPIFGVVTKFHLFDTSYAFSDSILHYLDSR